MLEQNSARNTKMHAKGAMAEMNSHRTQSNSLQTGIPKVFDLIGLLFHILESAKFVLTAIILCMALYGCSAFFSTPAYVATAKLYVSDPDMDIHDLQIASALVMDYREIFKTWEVHEAVRKDLNLPYSNDQMQSMLSITNPRDTRVLYITITHADAQMAAGIANAYAKAFRSFAAEMYHKIPVDISIAPVPVKPQSGGIGSHLLKGCLTGLMLSIVFLTLAFILDESPRTPEDILKYNGIPTLAVVPIGKKVRRHSYPAAKKPRRLDIKHLCELDFANAEALNTLAANLSYCGGMRKIILASRSPGEGKTYLSMNLMRTLAGIGHRVVLIDADLRSGGDKPEGLSEYLDNRCAFEDMLYQTDIPNAWMIPAGRKTTKPFHLLESKRMQEAIEELENTFDFMLLDTPATGILADALSLARHCDGVLLVVGYRRGRMQEINTLSESFRRTGCPVLGAVLNQVNLNKLGNRYHYYRARYDALRYSTNEK